MRNRIMASAAAGLFVAAALATPAAAHGKHHHDDPHDCPHNAVCFWEKPHFEGDMSVRWNPGHHCDEAPDHKIGSVVNNMHEKVRLYKDDDCDHLVEVVHGDDWDKRVHAHSWK